MLVERERFRAGDQAGCIAIDAGPRMDPPVSVPIAPAHNPAATAAPKPEPEPPMANSTYAALLLSGWANKRMFCSCSSARVQF